jgi:ferredoxin
MTEPEKIAAHWVIMNMLRVEHGCRARAHCGECDKLAAETVDGIVTLSQMSEAERYEFMK